jgi:hypothetical protein
MDIPFNRTVQITGLLILLAALTQATYTVFSMADADVPRKFLWGSEGVLFVLTAAFAGSALAQSRRYHLAWSAITGAAVLNVVQVGVGLTQFGPFFEAAGNVDGLTPAARSVVAFSFMVYNAAKVLLALALVVLGLGKLNSGARALGGISALVGAIALISNMASMAAGRNVFGDLPLAGASGVTATLLLAACLLSYSQGNH